jgi:hypothetical protein
VKALWREKDAQIAALLEVTGSGARRA